MLNTRLAATAALTALLGACTGTVTPAPQPQFQKVGSVDERQQSLSILLDSRGNVPETALYPIASAVAALGAPYATHAMVSGAETASSRSSVLRNLEQVGIPRTNVSFAGPAPRPFEIGLTLSRFVVTPPDCSGWGDVLENKVSNAPTYVLGCATARNLHLMVEDPRDLIVGRPEGPPEGTREVMAVDRYMTDKVKPLATNERLTSFEGR